MFTVKFYLPITANDGYVYESHGMFEACLIENFEGYTKYPGTYSGGWSFEGEVYKDNLVVYGASVKSIRDASKICKVVEMAKEVYGQKAIFVKYLGISEIL